MGLGSRIFIINEDDTIKRLSMKRYNRLLNGSPDECLPEFAGKRVRYALLVMELVNRKPVKILLAEFSFLAFDSEGRLDVNEQKKAARLSSDMLKPIISEYDSKHVIDAKYRFVQKRYESKYLWTPSPEISEAIMSAIIKR